MNETRHYRSDERIATKIGVKIPSNYENNDKTLLGSLFIETPYIIS